MANTIFQIFQKLRLSNKEIKICEALLKHRQLNITDLAIKTKIKRTGLYSLLPVLLKNRLIQKKIIGKRFFYSMSELESFADNLIADGLQLKEIAEQNKKDKDNIECELLVGKEQITKAMREMLKLPAGEIIYSIESPQSINLMKDDFVGAEKYWQRECVKRGIVLKGVGFKGSLKDILNWPNEVLKNMTKRSASPRLLRDDQLLNFQISLVAYADKIIIFSPDALTAVLITNRAISDSIKTIIDFIYLRGDYVNLNEEIRKKLNS